MALWKTGLTKGVCKMWQGSEQRGRLIAGAALILIGILGLVQSLGILTGGALVWVWIVVLGGAAAGFAWVCLTEKEPWAALGAYISGAIAVVILLSQVNLGGEAVACR